MCEVQQVLWKWELETTALKRKRLEELEMLCYKKLLIIKWIDKAINEDVESRVYGEESLRGEID